ncbi:low molecular weight phosphatase family protein [Protaetiibacter larvae]|uniref:Low molecular weight phosphatase family protein n=1 Tax=Protaetiibacter larvae TaxID=2592654 RepID=A0A5C1Y782_9MICO|nr:low molecular weight phosphatase family protein [Protaetiibacter larvae]QEO09510.1 low molecular weight phosphatase family protein [Protaetiibacter larvae]
MSTRSEIPFTVLVVCTGNICRSPQAERLLQAEVLRLGWAGDVRVSSAGVAALVGQPMPAQAAAQTIGYGGNPTGHAAKQLVEPLIEEADLVLTMERAHRAAVVRMVPRANRFAFTLPEFARLALDLRASGEAPPTDAALPLSQRLRALVPEVAAGRGLSLPVEAEHDEVEDPYGRSDEVYARSARQVASAVATVVEVLSELSRPDSRG